MFLEKDVCTTLSNLCRDKAPGFNCFFETSWKFNWLVLKEKVMGYFRELKTLKDFVSSLYKLLAKV